MTRFISFKAIELGPSESALSGFSCVSIKTGGHTDGNRGPCQHRRKLPLTAGTSAEAARLLNRVGGVKDDRTTGVFGHLRKSAHVGHQRIVAETGTPFRQTDVRVAAVNRFHDQVFHVPRCQKLSFFNIDDFTGLSGSNHQIRLPA